MSEKESNVTLDDEIAAARERIVERELSDSFDIFDATVLFMRPKLDAANAEIAEKDAEIARLRADVRDLTDTTDLTESRTVTDAGERDE